MEPALVQEQPIGDVDRLPGGGQVHVLGQIRVVLEIDVGDVRHVGGHVVIPLRLGPMLDGEFVGLAIEIRVRLGDDPHGLQPAGARGLHVHVALRHPAHGGEHGELVGPGVEGQLVAEVVRDLLMDHEIPGEGVEIPCILDALFEGAGEVGRHADGRDARVVELVPHHEVLGGGGDGQGLVDGQLEIHRHGLDFVDIPIAVHGVLDALVEHDHDPAQLLGGQGADDGQVFIEVHALVVGPNGLGELGVQGVDPLLGEGDGLLVDMLGAVQRHHGAARLESVLDLVLGLQMVPVGAVALLVPLLEHVEGGGGDHVPKGPVGQIQLPDGLLGQHRVDVVVPQGPDMAGARQA